MLIWLDNYTNTKGRPNENYARELMELFTLGVDQYTQPDVTEVARALTGWTITKPRRRSGVAVRLLVLRVESRRGEQDDPRADGQLGRRRRDPDHPRGGGRARQPLRPVPRRESLGVLRVQRSSRVGRGRARRPSTSSSNRSIRAVVDHIFRMAEFYEPHARKALIRSPVEYVVARAAAARGEDRHGTPAANLVPMGHNLFNPVDAKGWEGDLDWINTGHGLRPRLVHELARDEPGHDGNPHRRRSARPPGKTLATARDVVNALADRLGLADAPPEILAVWEKYVDSRPDGSRGLLDRTRPRRSIRRCAGSRT